MKLLTEGKSQTVYYVNYYKNTAAYYERNFFLRCDDKKRAFKSFRSASLNTNKVVTITECHGVQIADTFEPYYYKHAIIKTLATKQN